MMNKTLKKTAYYVTCNLPFVQGPAHICVLPKKSARYEFEICPPKRGNYKGVVVFQPGPWPIKYMFSSMDDKTTLSCSFFQRDIDSDGDEIPALEVDDPAEYQYSLWFTVDINVQAPNAQATVDLIAPCLVRRVRSSIYRSLIRLRQ
jgi:hypothetical protein